MQTKKESNLRRSAAYRKVDNAIFRARCKLRGNPDRQARRELLTILEKLEKAMRHTPMFETRHQTKLGYVRYADDFVILVNGTKEEAIDLGCPNRPLALDRFLDSKCQSRLFHAWWRSIFKEKEVIQARQPRPIRIFTTS